MSAVELRTLELRWFVPGALPKDVRAWFDRLPGPAMPAPVEKRTDTYLPTGIEELSVKLSRGSLETKLQLDALPFRASDVKLTGVSQMWRKWSWKYAAGKAGDPVLDAFTPEQGAQWIALDKERAQKKLALADGAWTAMNASSIIPLGAAIEITAITVRGKVWWSFAFDIYAPPTSAREVLAQAARRFAHDFPLALPASQSMSYPTWLIEVSKHA